MRQLSQERVGEGYVILGSLLWGAFPVVTILTFSSVSPFFSAGASTLIAAIFFALMLTWKKAWNEVLISTAWRDILLTTFFIGILYYALVFWGIQLTTAGNASLMTLTEIGFSYLILGLFLRHESLDKTHVFGALCMALGAIIVLFQGFSGFHVGDLIIVIGTIFAPIGNYFAQRARRQVRSITIMFLRSIISGGVLFGVAYLYEPNIFVSDIQEALPFLLLNGLLLLGLSKVFWLESIHRISISKATSFIPFEPVATFIFAYFILGDVPTLWQIAGLVPMAAGVYLLTRPTLSHA